MPAPPPGSRSKTITVERFSRGDRCQMDQVQYWPYLPPKLTWRDVDEDLLDGASPATSQNRTNKVIISILGIIVLSSKAQKRGLLTAIRRASVARPITCREPLAHRPLRRRYTPTGPRITTVSHSTSCQSNLYPRICRALADLATSFCRSSVKRNRTAQRVTCVSWPETSL